MTRQPLTDDVRRFVLTSIPSVPYLEAVLLMRSEPALPWDAQRIADRLYLPLARAAHLLRDLCSAGIAVETPQSGCLYQPPPQLEAMLDTLARIYPANLLAVTELIHSRMDRKAQHFADAFRWRKDG
jgi:hypothetical protein